MKHLLRLSFICLLTMLFGCQSVEVAKIEKPKEYTGEELFRGIFFLQGNVSVDIKSFQPYREKIEELKKNNPKAWLNYNLFVDDIVNQIKVINPAYFSNFSDEINSKDHYIISKSLEIGGQMIRNSGLQIKKYEPFFSKNKKIQEDIEAEEVSYRDIKISPKNGSDELGKKLFNKYYSTKNSGEIVPSENTPSTNLENPDDGIAVVAVVAIAVAIWEVAGVVNVVTILNFHNTVYVHMITKVVSRTGSGQEGTTSHEMLVNEIATSL